jgi:hypothetical protein
MLGKCFYNLSGTLTLEREENKESEVIRPLSRLGDVIEEAEMGVRPCKWYERL